MTKGTDVPTRIGTVSDFEDGRRVKVTIDGHEIVVFRHRDKLYAFDNWCLHMGGPVGEGLLMGKVEARIGADGRYQGEYFSDTTTHLVCPWHGWEYDIETGEAAGDRTQCLRRYEVDVQGAEVHVSV
jgi:nitrite reductase/ring-hydroxylating ferredoxin subunit